MKNRREKETLVHIITSSDSKGSSWMKVFPFMMKMMMMRHDYILVRNDWKMRFSFWIITYVISSP